MEIDPRLNDIDDCLYRVAARAFIVSDNKILLIKENDDDWWAIPGGGVDYGESIKSTLTREIEEELGIPASEVSSDFKIVYFNIGNVVNGIPRINIYFKAVVPTERLNKTNAALEYKWHTKAEFMKADIHASYDKARLAEAIFST